MSPGILLNECLPSVSEGKAVDEFHRLVEELSRNLGPSSGLDSNDVNVQKLQSLMEHYTSKEEDWKRYAFSDMTRGYTRNLVDEANGKSNLVSRIQKPFNYEC